MGALLAAARVGGWLGGAVRTTRGADLIERGVAEPADTDHPAKGRWVAVTETGDWLELATEAHQFVGEPAVGRDS